MFIRILLGIVFIAGIAGCATTRNKPASDQLQARVTELEKKIEEKDSEIVDLQYEVKDLSSKVETSSSKTVVSSSSDDASTPAPAVARSAGDAIRVNTTAEKVQAALKNAGFYTGKIDGKIGAGTKAAIVAFQKSKGLKADGVIGRKTWDALKQNLQ